VVAGTGVASVMASMVGGAGQGIHSLMVALMIASLILIIITAMAGSSRTLYQGSVDGWLPRYLSKVNHNGAPVNAMWTDLVFNLILLCFAADAAAYYYILAVSNCGYIIFNFLNLNAGWMHRMDAGHVKRPYRAPTIILAAGTVLAFVNAVFMGAGAKTWHIVTDREPGWYDNPLWIGIIFAALIVPVFCFRHYVQDGGKFPKRMLEDLGVQAEGDLGQKRAGMLPYVVLVAGLIVVIACNFIFELPPITPAQ
jgi:amino acid transporter